MSVFRYYWDANIFHALFNAEVGLLEACKRLADMAENGSVRIITSTITWVECVRLHGQPRKLTPENESIIRRYFDRSFIEPVNVTRKIGEDARHLLWKYDHLKYKDAIHVATAIFAGVDVLMSYDNDLLRLDGELGTPPLKIGEPPTAPPPEGSLWDQL